MLSIQFKFIFQIKFSPNYLPFNDFHRIFIHLVIVLNIIFIREFILRQWIWGEIIESLRGRIGRSMDIFDIDQKP